MSCTKYSSSVLVITYFGGLLCVVFVCCFVFICLLYYYVYFFKVLLNCLFCDCFLMFVVSFKDILFWFSEVNLF